MSALYPDVPNAPGVPPVLRQIGSYIEADLAALSTQTSDAYQAPTWGIYTANGLALDPDNVRALGFVGEYRIADYPIENGDFRSYNKVRLPFAVRIAMTKGGSAAERIAFVNDLETLRASLDLVNVVTPEATYIDLNVTRVSYDRAAEAGAGLMAVEIVLEEVRQTAAITYSAAKAVPSTTADTAAPSDAATSNPAAAPAATAKPKATIANPFAKAATKNPASATAVNRGAVQGASPINGFLPRLVTSPSGQKLYVYDVKAGG